MNKDKGAKIVVATLIFFLTITVSLSWGFMYVFLMQDRMHTGPVAAIMLICIFGGVLLGLLLSNAYTEGDKQ